MGSIWCHVRHDNMCRPIGVPCLGIQCLWWSILDGLPLVALQRCIPISGNKLKHCNPIWNMLYPQAAKMNRSNLNQGFQSGNQVFKNKHDKQKGEETMTLQSISFNIYFDPKTIYRHFWVETHLPSPVFKNRGSIDSANPSLCWWDFPICFPYLLLVSL